MTHSKAIAASSDLPPNTLQPEHRCDVLIVGCGVAGLSLALELPQSVSVCIIAKGDLSQSCTYYAQGGIAAALDEGDSCQAHAEDTIEAGVRLCDEKAVNQITEAGAVTIEWLQSMGVTFNYEKNITHGYKLHLTREGGHSHKRIAHYYDTTGKNILSNLYEKAQSRKNILISNHFIAVDLVVEKTHKQCVGVYALNKKARKVHTIAASATVLATGGAGKTYLYTTNPDSSSGDGIAMAWRAGCRIANMHLMQFHPTGLYHPKAKSFLISESLRGEGAKLLLPDGSKFMHRYDSREELAPRDVVARAIDHEMKKHGFDCVFLDISHRDREFILHSFPRIYQRCLQFGYDITTDRIPVVPMVHYTCGGICAEINGRTDIASLYAVGETAHTGLHGANRLASNSLLECIVCSRLCAADISKQLSTGNGKELTIPAWDESRVAEPQEEVIVSHGWNEIRLMMWDYVGIVRSYHRLLMAKQRIDLLLKEADEHYQQYKISSNSIEYRNLTRVASLIIESALARRESRGLHYMEDYPHTDHSLDCVNTILSQSN